MKNYLKKTKFVWLFTIVLFIVWFYTSKYISQYADLISDTQNVDPDRAMLCNIIAILIGVLGFMWRRRNN